jgi:tetratricopeptide (TPR) repeat protein
MAGRPAAEQQSRGYRNTLANMHFLLGSLEEARGLYAGLVAEYPGDFSYDTYMTYLGNLGRTAARAGDREEAMRIMALLEREEPRFERESPVYQRAKIAAWLGEKDLAVELLSRSYDLGLARGAGITRFNYNFVSLRDYPPFLALTRPKD